ncbi:HAD-IA family hydrolase [Patescibacteria group bacterium]
MEVKTDKEKDKGKPSVILMDLGKVILYSKEKLPGKMNPRHKELLRTKGEDYPFFDYFGVNKKLLELLADIKGDFGIYMITEGTIQNHPPLREKLESAFDFEKVISTGALGLDKKKTEAYEYVVQELGVEPSEILFVDDSPDNIKAASEVGLQVIQSASEDQVISETKEKLELI